MRVDKEFVLREIAGDYIIIPTGKTVLEFNGLITVNEVGVDIWKMLQEDVTFEDLVKGILDQYDVEEEVADMDLVPLKPKKKAIKAAMSNSFGFGGTNSSLIFKKYEG